MNINLIEGIQDLLAGILIPVMLSTGATIARLAQHGWNGIARFFAELAVSTFVGVCVHWGLSAFDFPPTANAAIVAASSFFCGSILDAFRQRIVHEIINRGASKQNAN